MMQEYTKPEYLNGAQLVVELEDAEVVLGPVTDFDNTILVKVDEFQILWLNVLADPNDQAAYVVAHHHGTVANA